MTVFQLDSKHGVGQGFDQKIADAAAKYSITNALKSAIISIFPRKASLFANPEVLGLALGPALTPVKMGKWPVRLEDYALGGFHAEV